MIYVNQITLDRMIDYIDEEWKWVDGFEGVYQISNRGRLKSFHKESDGYILSNVNKKGGYLSVILRDRKNKRYTRIHVLVAETFIGNIPKGYQVHHKDGNKQNNDVNNLVIISTKEHNKETMKQYPDYCKGMNDYNKYVRPKKILQYTKDGKFIAEYRNGKEAEIATGVCQRNILQVANKTPFNNKGGYRKQAGGFIWRFDNERG